MKRLNLFQRFSITAFLIMVIGTVGIGWWMGEQIKTSVIHQSASTSALYTISFISPNLQELANSRTITHQHIWTLDHLLTQTDLGRQIVTFKVWDQKGRVIYSTSPDLINRVFPVDDDLRLAWQGNIAANISNLQSAENIDERQKYSNLLQVYSPVHLIGTDQIIAVAEFYQTVGTLEADIRAAQWRTWLLLGAMMLLIYLVLVGFVRWTSNTIERQGMELTLQVNRLSDLLVQNGELQKRVQRAAAKAAAVNERFLRRISAELHDGPVQELGAALLRMDRVMDQNDCCQSQLPDNICHEQLPAIQTSLQTAIKEVRAVASGLGVPELEGLRINEVLIKAVNSHERRTGTKVKLTTSGLPDQTDLSIKITAYRVVQEALNNAFLHAGGIGQAVNAKCEDDHIQIEISDQGPGFDPDQPVDWDHHLGLTGMRERVQSLGGVFTIDSQVDHGACVAVTLPLIPVNPEL